MLFTNINLVDLFVIHTDSNLLTNTIKHTLLSLNKSFFVLMYPRIRIEVSSKLLPIITLLFDMNRNHYLLIGKKLHLCLFYIILRPLVLFYNIRYTNCTLH